ncbi:MAG TPA: DUF1648 domain-containing protein [Rhodoglobus sp.]|jgi:hypothetical protein|nr:DUF1648 domain-containing protein [Rhodoglobus sp.]HQI66581.1 DUF1648 domain-containing protein [Rhodoglobus sp.]
MNTTSRRREQVIGLALPVAILVISLAVMFWALSDLPDPVAVHWGPAGTPDAFGSPLLAFILLPVTVLAYLALPARVLARAHDRGPTANQRILLAVGPFLSTVLGVVLAGGLAIQRGLDDAAAGPSILPVVALAFGGGIVVGVVSYLLLPAGPAVEAIPDAADLPARPLGVDETAVWIRQVRPVGAALAIILTAGAILFIAGVTIVAFVQPIAVLLFVLPALLLVFGYACTYWTLTVDRHGVLLRGALTWPVIRIPLDQIESARVIDVDPLSDFGGWGLRWAPRTTGIIVRRGEALEVARRGRRALVVTLDRAAPGAELLNALVLRQRGGVR